MHIFEWKRGFQATMAFSLATLAAFSAMFMVSEGAVASPGWSKNVRVDNGPNPFLNQREPWLVLDAEGRLFVGWIARDAQHGDTSLPDPVAFSRSLDGGNTWSPTMLMDFLRPLSNRNQSDPWLALDGLGRLHFARLEFSSVNSSDPQSLVVSRSDDGGLTWSHAVQINDDHSLQFHDQPSLAVDGNDVVHAAWVDHRTGNYNVFYSFSKDGRRWSVNERVTDAETIPTGQRLGDYLGFAADRLGNVFAAWMDGRNANLDIYFAHKPATK